MPEINILVGRSRKNYILKCCTFEQAVNDGTSLVSLFGVLELVLFSHQITPENMILIDSFRYGSKFVWSKLKFERCLSATTKHFNESPQNIKLLFWIENEPPEPGFRYGQIMHTTTQDESVDIHYFHMRDERNNTITYNYIFIQPANM